MDFASAKSTNCGLKTVFLIHVWESENSEGQLKLEMDFPLSGHQCPYPPHCSMVNSKSSYSKAETKKKCHNVSFTTSLCHFWVTLDPLLSRQKWAKLPAV